MQEAGASLLGTHRHPRKCSAVLASLRLWFDLFFPSLIFVGQAAQEGWSHLWPEPSPGICCRTWAPRLAGGCPWCSHNPSWGCNVSVAAVAVSILRPFAARIPPFRVHDLVVYLAAQIIPKLWHQVTENRNRQQHVFTFCL